MALGRLDHLSIRTAKLEETRRFYIDVLGLEEGFRPAFKFPGVWLYHQGQSVVHVVGVDPNDMAGLIEYLGDKNLETEGTGTVDHVAFVAQDLEGMKTHFTQRGAAFRERLVPSMNLAQLFLEDPNGVTIELNFPHGA